MLPDDVLLAIFDFSVFKLQIKFHPVFGRYHAKVEIDSWKSLVHVCRRWRGLVFGSPRSLNLQLLCTPRTSSRKSLDVWPALPLFIQGDVSETSVDNVIAELEHSNRICHIDLDFHTTSHIPVENLLKAMQVPFPELAVLFLSFAGLSYAPVLQVPYSLLGGSAPRLRSLKLVDAPFLGLPKLLSFATNLVELSLLNIPHSGYISPEAMVTCLSVLTSLEDLHIEFYSPQSCPDQETRRPPPPTRSVLLALKKISFKGVNEYSEELLARIDTPRLDHFSTIFFNDINFDIPELIRFFTRTFKAPNAIRVVFGSLTARIALHHHEHSSPFAHVKILCRVPDWQLSSMAQICTSFLPFLSTPEHLYIHEDPPSPLDWKDGIENTEWLELLVPFTAVKNLYLSEEFQLRIAPALQEITGGGIAEVLSTLQNIYLKDYPSSKPIHEAFSQFISVRNLTIYDWDRYGGYGEYSDRYGRYDSYYDEYDYGHGHGGDDYGYRSSRDNSRDDYDDDRSEDRH